MAYKRDKQLAKDFRKPCVVCSRPGVGDHILNFKRIPSRDKAWNMWSLCWDCHHEKTISKLNDFVKKYKLAHLLIEKEFYLLENDKWWHKDA